MQKSQEVAQFTTKRKPKQSKHDTNLNKPLSTPCLHYFFFVYPYRLHSEWGGERIEDRCF
jgi:hypothetical protein